MQRQVDDMRVMLAERYETQTKAIDAAFVAQQTAMQTALTAAERAVQTASSAAEKAVLKAESAAEKRFEAVNEFRGQLADQQNTFMPRELADTQFQELRNRAQTLYALLDDRLRAAESRIDKATDLNLLARRLDQAEGREEGGGSAREERTSSSLMQAAIAGASAAKRQVYIAMAAVGMSLVIATISLIAYATKK